MNPIKITNFKSGEILFYQLQKLLIFALIVAFVVITAPIIRPNKFSYNLPELAGGFIFLMIIFIIYLFFERYLFFIILDKDREELTIEFYYLFKKKNIQIKVPDLSYQNINHKGIRIIILDKGKKVYTISEDDACLEKQQVDYLIKLLKEYNIRSI